MPRPPKSEPSLKYCTSLDEGQHHEFATVDTLSVMPTLTALTKDVQQES